MAETPITVPHGSWVVTRAFIARWMEDQLDAKFRAYWPESVEAQPVLYEAEAKPQTPGPYCVYRQTASLPLFSSTAGAIGPGLTPHSKRFNQMDQVPFNFEIHAQTRLGTGGNPSKSGKLIAEELAREVCLAFDRGGFGGEITQDGGSRISDVSRVADFPTRLDDDEWSWSIFYVIMVDGQMPLVP